MRILRFPLGQLQANCYFLIHGSNCLIIDPADDAPFITEELQRRNLKLVAMIATHGHFDHVMAAREVQMSYQAVETHCNASLPFYINLEDTFLIKRLGETAKYFLGYDPQIIPPQKMSHLQSGSTKIDEFTFEVIEAPGHTPGSVCLYFKKEKIIFTGDTLFWGTIGRYDFSYSSKSDLKQSIEKLLNLPKDVVVYPGHGEETTIGEEQENFKLWF